MSRRKARLVAVQYLYSKQFNSSDMPSEFIEFVQSPKKDSDKEFTKKLIEGAIENKQEIDSLISKYAQQGEDIVSLVDKCILGVGIYELLYLKEIPPPVVINEYVEITKELSKDSSKSFINAILDKVRMEIENEE